ncbi:MAG: MFS transporter [Gammaproteobacteria bacterium]|nr:MFS transporter [Gammaproteobacteria bacterium]
MPNRQSPYLTLLAGVLVTTVLGSIHAFSVFIFPLEQEFGASRTQVSLIYSLALVTLTIFVLLGYKIYSRLCATKLIVLACVIASAGLALAAASPNLITFVLGYSLLFGAANGVGYGFVLQLVAQALPHKRGFAMGTVTAAYAVGASVFAKLIAFMIYVQDYKTALLVMAVVLLGVALIARILAALSNAQYQQKLNSSDAKLGVSRAEILQLGMGYGLGVAAGLMVIGHAAAIVASRDPEPSLAVLGVMLISIGNAIGGLVAGFMCDRWPVNRLLILLPAISMISLFALIFVVDSSLTIAGLTIVGICYGAIIAVYPIAILVNFGTERSAQVWTCIYCLGRSGNLRALVCRLTV